MASLTDNPTDDQMLMLSVIHEGYRTKGRWPDWRYVKRAVQRDTSSEPSQIRNSFPTVGVAGSGPSYGLVRYNAHDLGNDCEMGLYVAAGLHIPEFARIASTLVEIIQCFAEAVNDADPDEGDVIFTHDRLAKLKQWDPNLIPMVPDLLSHEPFGLFSQSMPMTDGRGWKVTLRDDGLFPYSKVGTIEDYTAKVVERIKAEAPSIHLESTQNFPADAPIDDTSFDPELWLHVRGHIEAEEWPKVASQTAIFVEHRVRQYCGDPKGRDNRALVGKGLFAKALGDDSQYRLGSEKGEWEGWRFLGMGFSQALSNVDRHNIQERDDAKRYAFGVLGLGSLILTQLRYQHDDILVSR